MSPHTLLYWMLFALFVVCPIDGRIHNLKLQNDNRHQMTLSTFGFLKGGTLAVNISMFTFKATAAEAINNKIFGFTLDKSNSPGLSNYVESVAPCIWNKPEDTLVSVFFKFDLHEKRMNIERKGKSLQHLKVVAVPRKQYLFDKNLEHGENLAAMNKDQSVDSKDTTGPDSTKKENGKPADAGENEAEKTAETDSTNKDTKKGAESPSRKTRAAIGDGKGDATAAGGNKKEDKTLDDAAKAKAENDKKEAEKTSKDAATGNKDAASGSDKKGTATAKPEVIKKPPALPDKPLEISDAASQDLVSSVPITMTTKDSMAVYHSYFLVHVQTEEEEGLYNLFFHNCLRIDSLINLTLQIIEDNNGNYLSADEMPIPLLYFVFNGVFLVLSFVWLSVLRKAEEGVYKLHYLMLTVVFVKSVSCLFHGINMYMIQKNGIHVDAWAILWYIVYLTRGALMFVTVLLIGAGWAFIKHIFSDREKKLFLIVMPLQILANVAWVIVEESEEGTSSYTLWNRIFMVVDLLCCFAILFPVIWSIRHLQEASRTDGKAAINLNKLKLFKQFYILVVCYIYFSRIIVYLLKIVLPFHYGWMRNLFAEVFLLGFFTLTGYKFRPTNDNPYLQVPMDSDDEEEIEMEEVLTKTGNMDSLTRVNMGRVEEDERMTTIKQRESSHEFD